MRMDSLRASVKNSTGKGTVHKARTNALVRSGCLNRRVPFSRLPRKPTFSCTGVHTLTSE